MTTYSLCASIVQVFDYSKADWYDYVDNPANIKHLYNIYTMLDQRRRRWVDVV